MTVNQLIGKFLLPIIVTLVAGGLLYEYQKEHVDLRYTLSESIPTSFLESSASESVQQLTIRNSGNISSGKIQLKIKTKVIAYDLMKHSVEDIVTVSQMKNSFESSYPNLPPDSQYTYVFRTADDSLSHTDIEITYPKGKGVDALSKQSEWEVAELLYYLFILALAFLFFRDIFRELKASALNFPSYKTFSEVLALTKPFYVTRVDWNKTRGEYLNNLDKKDLSLSLTLEDDDSYRGLNLDKPDYLSNEEWEVFKVSFSSRFERVFEFLIKSSIYTDDIEKMFLVKKPLKFSQIKWNELVNKASHELYKINCMSHYNSTVYLNAEGVLKQIQKGRPSGMEEEYWERYLDGLKNKYFMHVLYEAHTSFMSGFINLESFDLNVLKDVDKKKMESFLYTLNKTRLVKIDSLYAAEEFIENDDLDWLSPPDHTDFTNLAKTYVALEHDANMNEVLLGRLQDIIDMTHIGDKPNNIEVQLWDKLVKIEEDILILSKQNQTASKALESEKVDVDELKDKVLKQLRIINHTFENPNAPMLIEDYDNPFSSGNLANLKKVGNLLKGNVERLTG
jgi:hypothetical protein